MYGKLFDSIFDSSIMEEPVEVRYIWQCMIALADGDGNVDMTEAALARRTNVDVHTVHNAIEKLSKPDPASRSPERGGRRIVPIDVHRDWGWHLVNREKYADIRSSGDRTTYWREQKRRKRAEKGISCLSTSGQSGQSTASTNIDVDVDVDVEEKTIAPSPKDSTPPAAESVLEYPTVGKVKSWHLTRRDLGRLELAFPALDARALCLRAKAWCDANPSRLKTARGMPKFLDSFFAREQEKPNSAYRRAPESGNGHKPQGKADATRFHLTRARLRDELFARTDLAEPERDRLADKLDAVPESAGITALKEVLA